MPKLKKKKGESVTGQNVRTAMHEMKRGKLHSGSKAGPVVKDKKQAVAIGLSEARKAGAKVPDKKKPSAKADKEFVAKFRKKTTKDGNRLSRNKGRK